MHAWKKSGFRKSLDLNTENSCAEIKKYYCREEVGNMNKDPIGLSMLWEEKKKTSQSTVPARSGKFLIKDAVPSEFSVKAD